MHGFPAWSAVSLLSPLCLFIFVSSFYLILSLCIAPLPSCPEYRIMTQFSWAVRASREMVSIATAPVLIRQPTIAWAWVHCIVLATLAQMILFVHLGRVFDSANASEATGGKQANVTVPSSISLLISVSSVSSPVNAVVITQISSAAAWRAAITGSPLWLMAPDLESNSKPLSASGEEVLT